MRKGLRRSLLQSRHRSEKFYFIGGAGLKFNIQRTKKNFSTANLLSRIAYILIKKVLQIQELMRNGWLSAASSIIIDYVSLTTPDLQHTAFQTPYTQLMF